MTLYDRGNVKPESPFKDNEDLYRDERGNKGFKDRTYVIKKSWFFNWDDVLEKIFKRIFRKKRR